MNGCHFILGGVRSGKSREAQVQALAAEREGYAVRVLVTALAADDEMRVRIARHRAERPASWRTVEVPATADGLAEAVAAHDTPNSCLVIDCLTVWLSQLMCPPPGQAPLSDPQVQRACARCLQALAHARGRTLVVSNEIGLGVVPVDAATRRVVDALGLLHQRLAAHAASVSWMVAGLPLAVKQ